MNKRSQIWIGALLACAALGAAGAYLMLGQPKPPVATASRPVQPKVDLAACRPGEPTIDDPTHDESVLAALYGKENLVTATDGITGGEHGALGNPVFSNPLEDDWSGSFQSLVDRQKITLGGTEHWVLILESAQLDQAEVQDPLPPHTVRLDITHAASRETAVLLLSACRGANKTSWQPQGHLEALGQFGSMGSGASVSFITLGKDHPGVLLSGAGTWQGFTIGNSELFAWDGKHFARVLSFQDTYTEEGFGACGDDADATDKEAGEKKPACREVDNKLDLKPHADAGQTAPNWLPIVVHSRFVDAKGVEHKRDVTLTYRKGQYQPVKGTLPEVEA
ncbi:MAG: hypothetical protein JO142_16245 [Burkholderiales bacterium]|nr:hypothetical protein [Burkholderiales bacterium]